MSPRASNPVRFDLPLARQTPQDRGEAGGIVGAMQQEIADRWLHAVERLTLAPTPRHPAERAVAALSRAAGPVALALGFLMPIAALLR